MVETAILNIKSYVSHIELPLKKYSLWEFGKGKIKGRTSERVLIKHFISKIPFLGIPATMEV